MRNYSKLSPFFWLKGSGKRLRGDALAQVIASYVSTGPDANMVGIFFLSLATIASHTGHSLDDVRAAIVRIEQAGYAYYDFDAELVWIPNHALFEIGDAMKKADKRRGKVLAELAQVRGHRFVDDFKRIYGMAYGISANESMGLPEMQEGASAIDGQGNHRTGQTQGQDQGKGASAPTPVPERGRWDGNAGMRQDAKAIYEVAAGEALGRIWRFPNPRFHLDDLLKLVSDYGPPEASQVRGWLDERVRAWIRSADDPKENWHPSRFADWLARGGKPATSKGRGSGGGPRGDRQGLDGWTPPQRTGTDNDHPFGGDE